MARFRAKKRAKEQKKFLKKHSRERFYLKNIELHNIAEIVLEIEKGRGSFLARAEEMGCIKDGFGIVSADQIEQLVNDVFSVDIKDPEYFFLVLETLAKKGYLIRSKNAVERKVAICCDFLCSDKKQDFVEYKEEGSFLNFGDELLQKYSISENEIPKSALINVSRYHHQKDEVITVISRIVLDFLTMRKCS